MSFGTGHHATTEMMVRRMEQISFSGKNVFDFGTGTGVLAILAEKCGAAQVLAIDNDPWSIANAKENAIENGCTRIHLQLADTPDTARQFDIILANINRNIILDNMPALVEALSHDGTLLVSGMLAEDETALLAGTEGFQLRPVARMQTGPWICMQFAY
jgi:ribosomal protein L11 methyltransferase